MEQEQYPSQESPMMKPPMYSQHYPQAGSMAQGNYMGHQDPAFHGMPGLMGQRMGYPMLRLPARPGGPVPAQPNNLRLQLQHRLQAQLVGRHTTPWSPHCNLYWPCSNSCLQSQRNILKAWNDVLNNIYCGPIYYLSPFKIRHTTPRALIVNHKAYTNILIWKGPFIG